VLQSLAHAFSLLLNEALGGRCVQGDQGEWTFLGCPFPLRLGCRAAPGRFVEPYLEHLGVVRRVLPTLVVYHLRLPGAEHLVLKETQYPGVRQADGEHQDKQHDPCNRQRRSQAVRVSCSAQSTRPHANQRGNQSRHQKRKCDCIGDDQPVTGLQCFPLVFPLRWRGQIPIRATA
jgi:hypothetical protein